MKGNKKYLNGHFNQALKFYLRALKLFQGIGVIHFNIALCFLSLEKNLEAKKHFFLAKKYARANKEILESEYIK